MVQSGHDLYEYGQTFLAQPEELDVRRVEKNPAQFSRMYGWEFGRGVAFEIVRF